MTLRAVLACAAVLAIGCKKKVEMKEYRPEPARPVPLAPDPKVERCGPAIEHLASLLEPVGANLARHLGPLLSEACRRDPWSDELIACLTGARRAADLQPCKSAIGRADQLATILLPLLEASALPTLDDMMREADPRPAPPPLEARLLGYAKLLAIDLTIFQTIEAYPGAPKGTTFETGEYRWRRPEWLALDAMQPEVDAILASTALTPSTSADPAVRAYAEKLTAWLPRLSALAAYHDEEKFIDDEFDRGRKEAADLRRTAAELARLRGPMRSAVFGAWRAHAPEYRHTPRAAAAHAWMACTSIADRVMEKARPDAIGKAVSACRRSIPKLSEIATASGFDADVRKAASELGDWVAQSYPSWRTHVSDALGGLTTRYIELWPTLPATPAEKPAP